MIGELRLPRRVMASIMSEPDIALVTIPSVELIEVGEDWETMSGPITFDEQDLKSAIASQDDPAIRTPVLKLGHVDPRFDGQPSFGRITNLALTNNEQTLVGDYTAIPAWLAKCMATAYPRRSIEGWYELRSRTGNTWPFVLTGLALLGDAYPAISTLEDISLLMGSTMPTMVAAPDIPEVLASRETDHGTYFLASKGGDEPVKWRRREEPPAPDPEPAPVAASAAVMAGVSVDDIRMAYYDSLNPDQYWWWIRQMRVAPAELIVDDDEGHLFRVEYTIDAANDTVVFAEPKQVKEEYVDVAVQAAAGHVVRLGADWTNPVVAGRPRERLQSAGVSQTATAAATITTDEPESEVPEVNLSEEALRALGLEPGATEDQINEALVAKLTTTPATGDNVPAPGEPGAPTGAPTEPDGGPVTAPTTTGQPSTGDPAPTNQPNVPEGMALVDAATLAEIRAGAVAATAMVEAQRIRDRDAVIRDCVKAGKFPRSRVEHYTTLWETDPEGTRATLASLQPGLIPVEEHGYEGGETDPAMSAYPESWKPAVAAANRGVAGSRVKVVND